MRVSVPLLLLVLLSACAGPRYAGNGWDGRRGYDGNGDYGYDPTAERAEARSYRAQASRNYPPPGPPEDPWGPYVQQAAARFGIPERWIREVMRQESGGRLEASDGSLTTSGVGAMGLMQVMPATYDTLRQHYALGDDAYEPHDNIMAGAAYIREMYDRFGAPAFLAAYNAGPDRLTAYLGGTTELPDETVNYLSRIAPRLGTEVAMTGPLAVYAGGGTAVASALPQPGAGYGGGGFAPPADPADQAYAGGGMSGVNYYSGNRDTLAATNSPAVSDRAYDGGGQVAAAASTGYGGPAAFGGPTAYDAPAAYGAPAFRQPAGSAAAVSYLPASPPVRGYSPAVSPAAALVPLAAPGSGGGWGIQVGAYPDPVESRAAAGAARASLGGQLAGAQPMVTPVQRNGGTLYRARLLGLTADSATAACGALSRRGVACFTVPPGA